MYNLTGLEVCYILFALCVGPSCVSGDALQYIEVRCPQIAKLGEGC